MTSSKFLDTLAISIISLFCAAIVGLIGYGCFVDYNVRIVVGSVVGFVVLAWAICRLDRRNEFNYERCDINLPPENPDEPY